MVPELFDDHMLDVKDLMKEELMLLKILRAIPTASFIVEGYTEEQKELLQQGFPNSSEKYYNNFDSSNQLGR